MSDDKINLRVTVKCQKCGNPSICLPDEPGDEGVITCPACGSELGTVGQLNAHIREGAGEIAKDLLKKALSDAFGDSPNFKLKL